MTLGCPTKDEPMAPIYGIVELDNQNVSTMSEDEFCKSLRFEVETVFESLKFYWQKGRFPNEEEEHNIAAKVNRNMRKAN